MTPIFVRKLIGCSRWLILLLAIPAAADPYQQAPTSKALAVAAGPLLRAEGSSEGQPSDLTAALSALVSCGQRRQELGVPGACEIVRLNDQQIRTGAEIRRTVPDDHPLFLWRVTNPSTTLYLAGSIHVLKATLYPLPRQFEEAFEQSDALVVEVDTVSTSPAVLQRKTLEYALLDNGVTLDEVVAPATFERLDAYLGSQGMSSASLAMLKPAMIATQLAVTRLMALGYTPDQGLEQHFIGRIGSRRILQLETLDAQLALLSEPPMTLQEQLLIDTLDQLDQVEPLIADLITAWFAGDDLKFRELFDAQTGQSDAYRKFMEQLLGERNRAMTRTLESYLSAGGRYFVLVGAAHLTGPDGIIALLEAAGHRSHRVGSDEAL